MRKPDESLDDYTVKLVQEVTPEPPPSVLLQRTGEVEVLKPLTAAEARAKRTTFRKFRRPMLYQPVWFRRFLVAGSGALVFMALVLVSAILVSMSDQAAAPDVAINGTLDERLMTAEEFDASSPSGFTWIGAVFHSNTRRRPSRSSVQLTARVPRRELRPLLQAEEPKFVPTTLVIYAENGVINTRIEPWFPAADKKPATLDN